jgi:hypothetical protein
VFLQYYFREWVVAEAVKKRGDGKKGEEDNLNPLKTVHFLK